jgi:hypothetical protein
VQWSDSITFLATTNHRGIHRPFGIKRDDRRRHMYVIGKTGMGKSTLLEHMIAQDLRGGEGLALVDPHGDLVERILRFVPRRRMNDVVYVNPSDLDYPVAFNVLEAVDPSRRHLAASGLIAVFKKLYGETWGPRLEYILRNTVLALLEYEHATLLGIPRMYVDDEFRRRVVSRIRDGVVKAFWTEEFEGYAKQFRTEAVAPIQNKIGQFLSSPLIRNIVGQVRSTIDLRRIMDERKILLLNLSKGRIGEDNAALLGALFITNLQLAAMSRIDVPETDRPDFFLYVDEFQDFATDSFTGILSEARKYRLCLIVAHQYIAQLDETVRDAVFGNVGTILTFRIGAKDAEVLEEELAPVFTSGDLVELSKFDCYLRLMIDGVASRPFSATTFPPLGQPENEQDKIIRLSRERYGRPREGVEQRITAWLAGAA